MSAVICNASPVASASSVPFVCSVVTKSCALVATEITEITEEGLYG